MVGPWLQPAQAKLVQPRADGAFVHRHAEAPRDLLAQVQAPPADHTVCQSASKTFQGIASKSFQLIVSLAPTDCVVWAGTEAPGYRDRRAPSVASKAFRELGCLEIFDMAAQLQHGVERLRRCAVFET